MACEKVLIDYDLFTRYKGYEQKYHSLKAEIEELKANHEDLEKKYNEQKENNQSGSGNIQPNSELQTRLIADENGIINNDTQKIIPMDNAIQEDAKVETLPFESVVSNNNEKTEKKCTPQKWYFIDVPKNVKL